MAIFAKYDGIDGESVDSGHSKWIDILSVEWGAQRLVDNPTGGSRRRKSAEVEDLVMTFYYEKAAVKLLEKCLEGGVLPQLDIEFVAPFGGQHRTYLKYKLENVLVTAHQFGAYGGVEDEPPIVQANVSFEEIKITYTEHAPDGDPKGNSEVEYRVEEDR